MSSYKHFGCSWCEGPFNCGNCPGCSSIGFGNEFVYDLNLILIMKHPTSSANLHSANARHTHSQSPPKDLDFHSHFKLLQMETNRLFEEMLRPIKPIPLVGGGAPEGSDDYTEVTLNKEQCFCDHYTAHVTPSPLAYTPPIPFLATMEPLDTFLIGDEVISTILIKEIDEFIKSSIHDLVPILRGLEVTSVCDNLECDMPVTTPLPTTDVREEDFDIN
ncbi:hypothetical protein Tco_0684810 [Tanacetum coccineum]